MDENGNPTKPALPVSIGAGGVIPGFEKALIGMRAGETKSVAVAPEDGYTTQTNTTEGVDYEDLAPVFTITENKSSVLGVTQEEIPLSEVNAQLFEGKNPGDILAEQNGTTVKLISKTDTSAQVEFIATSSPFYGKELTVGMSETFNGVTFTVTKIEGDNVTLDVINTNSPFYKEGENKALEDGAIAEMDENGTKISIKILKVHTAEDWKKTLDIEETTTPALAGKTLYFTIKVDKVSAPNSATSSLDLSQIVQEVSTGTTEQ